MTEPTAPWADPDDVVEQAAPITGSGTDDEERPVRGSDELDVEAPEADVLEQRLEVGADDGYDDYE